MEQVQEVLLISKRNLSRYVKIYKEKGIDGLLELSFKGGIPKLSMEQERMLCNYIDNAIISNSKQVVAFIKEWFNINYTKDGMVITLHRIGYSYKKTKIKPSKADKTKQEAFVAEYEKLRTELKPDETIYFLDGVHPTHNVMPAYCWIKKGEEREVKSNTGRDRMNINGAYSPINSEVITVESDRINSQSTIELLKKIEGVNPHKTKIYIILDNAKYYNSNLVKEYLKNSKMIMMPLPTYSPNLDLIGRLWHYFKKKVLYNRYYSTFAEFKGAVNEFFNYINIHKNELKTLMTEKIHIFQT